MNSSESRLILISGLPGSGKTVCGRTLSKHYQLPYIDYDTVIQSFMEKIYSSFYQRISYNQFCAEWRTCTYEAFWRVISENMALGISVAASAPLSREHRNPRFFEELKEKYRIKGKILSIITEVPEEVLYSRILERGETRDEEKLKKWEQYYEKQEQTTIWDADEQFLFCPGDEQRLYEVVDTFLNG